jgi:hypothetical protein
MEKAKKILLIILCVVAAVILQGLLGELLMQFSSWVYPREVTSIGMFGAAIAHPLFFGLYFLPFTTWGLYLLSNKIMDMYGQNGN